MSSPKLSPTTVSEEGPELDALWRQLREVNSIIASLGKQASEIRMQRFELKSPEEDPPDGADNSLESLMAFLIAQADKLLVTRGKLEDLRDFLRMSINKRVRPTLRRLNILDLPDELLRQMFKYVWGGLPEYDLYFSDYTGGDVGQVKAIRQVCRRFRDTSSHLLLRCVKVNMTRPSIAHLEEVSRQPVISKDIRAIRVILCFYDSVLAGDIRAFAAYQASRLRKIISAWQDTTDPYLTLTDIRREVYTTAIAKAIPIAESWEDAAAHNICDDSVNCNLLRRAHGQYKQCYMDETILRQGIFVQAIAEAMAKMPRATWLQMYDHDIHNMLRWEDTVILTADLNDHELLLDKLSTPIMSWEDARIHGLGEPPAELIPRLLLAIHEEGVSLTGLDIWTPLPEDLSVLVLDRNRLVAAVKHLRVFSFTPRHINNEDGFWVTRAADEWTPFQEFLSILLSSTPLQIISLEFDFLYSDELAPLLIMGPVVSSQSWPKLKSLSFIGPFHLAELRSVVYRAERTLYLQWTGDLMSGSWAEVLDLMKESISKEVLSYQSDIEPVNGRPSGQECNQMTRREAQHIFCRQYLPEVKSLAEKYIRGRLKSNPVRNWANGDLVVPEDGSP